MSRARIALCALAALFLASACNQEDMLKKFASDQDEKVARECIDTMRHGKLDEIEARLDPHVDKAQAHAGLQKMLALVPPGEPDAVKLVGAYKNVQNGVHSSSLTYQYTYGAKYVGMRCETVTDGNPRTILAMEVRPMPVSYEEMSRFQLKGKSAFQYGVLVVGVIFLVMSLVALIRCIMDKNLRRKWLWILFILFGVGQLSVDWTSGASEFHTLHFLLFSASAVSSGYGPWIVSIALPVGAAVYLVRRFLNHRAALRSNVG